MTKKHFEAAAVRVLRIVNEAIVQSKWGRARDASALWKEAEQNANFFADLASDFNSQFDRDRFFVACGLRSKVVAL